MSPEEAEIMRALEVDGSWQRKYDSSDYAGIAAARTDARRAGRELGVKIRTTVHYEPGGPATVLVWRNEPMPSEDQERIDERQRQAMDRAWDEVEKRDQSD